ncbi:fumarylacetoacetate hydrolase [Cyclonatronum proteinivorum]|uniref:fumarylacetoacetase n=1 Tax=Cyclonatronum proteinivorum TaxID=1457365 RepID=A0A345UND2_9BACT|nr:fumarylacetoacetase [Cyclonatronum proteinivorum]AXJ01984.1 fumarylacetoacetate hydrolase [Cyclonatronum proteinivorum]
MPTYDATTDPALKAFFDIPAESHFPIQNLPFGVFRPAARREPRIGVAIGEYVLDLKVLQTLGFFDGPKLRNQDVFEERWLNDFMDLGKAARVEARQVISDLLSGKDARLKDDTDLQKRALVPMKDVVMELPVQIGDYTDFYSSREHATNVGTMFRGKDNALQPNWLHLPVGYHGRSSSVVISGTPLHRPMGQTKADDAAAPSFGPSRLVDFELEMGFFVSGGNALGKRLSMAEAEDHIFGLALVNDWSARDIQKWEYVPLGPFLAKNFGTSISPWIITLEALEPFRVAGPAQTDPEVLDYLKPVRKDQTYDLRLEVAIQGEKMDEAHTVCVSNFKYLYWSMAQQLVHHAATGCNMRTGDLLASGTISGPTEDSYGSMLELSWRGSKPLAFPNGETRKFLQDGDTVIMTGWAQGNGYRVGFGSCEGKLLPVSE